MFDDDVEPKCTHQEKYEAYEYLITYVKSGVEICDDMLGYGILKDVLDIIKSFEDPRSKKSNVENCTAFLSCIFALEEFFRLTSPAFLKPGERDNKRLLSPLSAVDACNFLDKIVQQVSSSELNKYQVVGIIGVFASAVKKGLLDNIVSAMNLTVKCSTDVVIPSPMFPLVSSSTDVEKINSLLRIFLNLFMGLKVKQKRRRYNLGFLVVNEFRKGFFGRLHVVESAGGNGTR